MRVTPLPQRAVSRGLSPADHAKATRLSREMALFTKLQGGSAPTAAKLAPGTAEFTTAAKKDYADLLEMHGAPKLPTSFVVKSLTALPEPVKAAYDSFRLQHSDGHAQIALSTIDGHRTWQAQVTQIGGAAQVLLIGEKGAELARGVVRGAAVSWRW